MNNTNIKELKLYNEFKEFYLNDKEDAIFMTNIDIEEFEEEIKISEQEIKNG